MARAARAVGAVDQVLARFGKATAAIGEGKGLMLEAKEGENTVQIFRDGGDGKPKLLFTDSDVAAMEKSIEEGGKLQLPIQSHTVLCADRGRLRELQGLRRRWSHQVDAPSKGHSEEAVLFLESADA